MFLFTNNYVHYARTIGSSHNFGSYFIMVTRSPNNGQSYGNTLLPLLTASLVNLHKLSSVTNSAGLYRVSHIDITSLR